MQIRDLRLIGGRAAAVVVFASPAGAESGVAGLPAAARVVREVALAGIRECWIEAGPDWRPSPRLRAEVERLRGEMTVYFPDGARPLPHAGRVLWVAGEALPAARMLLQAHDGATAADGAILLAPAWDTQARQRLARPVGGHDIGWHYAGVARAIVRATGKPTDGIASRHINRPISRTITGLLLHIPGFRPSHATFGTAALGVLMFAALLLMGQPGLLAGALLFQAASVFDGVDGEAARATFRSSRGGAMFDSLVDAATNLAFVLGLVINLARRGEIEAAGYGVCGLLLLAAGLTIIGLRARASAAPFTFDGVKDRIRGTRFGQWLVWLTMRDFLALASVVLVLLGLAEPALMVFSIAMAGWLVVVVATGRRHDLALR